MKILWLTNIPSPYRVSFFEALGKLCDLTVLFEKRSSDERDDSWKEFEPQNFKAVFLKGKQIGVAEAFCPGVVKYLKKNMFDHIVVTNFSDPTGWLAILTLRLKGIKYAIESDGGFAGNGKGIKEKVKRFFVSGASLCYSTAEKHDEYYMAYGATKDKIIRYPFTSLCEQDVLEVPYLAEEKKALRESLGIGEEKVLLAIGQFIPRKGFDVLIKAMAGADENIGCYIVGGEPTPEYQELVQTLQLKNVHFVGFKTKTELEKYYLATDIFAHPTREDIWGLVINEAMAKGLVVVTTDRCIAGLELVQDGVNGCIIPIEDEDALRKAIGQAFDMATEETASQILDRIRNYTVERMALVHMETLEK